MKTEELIDELNKSGNLSADTIEEIEENRILRHDLIRYFDEHKNRAFVLELLAILTELRQDPSRGVSGDSLMLACYILGKHGQIEDCMKIWETKQIDFDTYCYVDIQLVPFAGVQQTIDYLRAQTSKEAIKASEYLLGCSAAGDFDHLEQYFSETPWFV